MLARNFGRGFPNLITIEDDDDDDDVLMYTSNPRSSSGAMVLFPLSSSWAPTITEEDLELRLGFKAHNVAAGPNPDVRGEPSQTWKHIQAKCGMASSSRDRSTADVEGLKLRCTICMDTMEEETSTVCGHVFCKSCITDAIRIQNRCPTCRRELTLSNIHRIYLPGATS